VICLKNIAVTQPRVRSFEDARPDTQSLLKELLGKMPVSKAASEAAQLTGLSKRDLYQQALAIKDVEEE